MSQDWRAVELARVQAIQTAMGYCTTAIWYGAYPPPPALERWWCARIAVGEGGDGPGQCPGAGAGMGGAEAKGR